MKRQLSQVALALVLGLVGCGSELKPMGPAGSSDGLGDPAGTDGGASSAVSGVPCEVAQLLTDYCVTCHKAPPLAPAPMALVSLSDLMASSPNGGSYAERSVERMRDANKPMPPAGAMPSAAQIDAFDAWVMNGMPAGNCDTVAGPFDGPSVCTTGTYWTGGNQESPYMRPGGACIDCHTNGGGEHGPRFSLAGTVYAGPHDPADCNGVDGQQQDQVVIEVTDANQRVVRTSANRVGNFYSNTSLTLPIKARILYQGRVREMLTEQPSADCNSCHTKDGTQGAPGRLLLP